MLITVDWRCPPQMKRGVNRQHIMTLSTLSGIALVGIGVSAATAQSRWPADQDRYQLGNLDLDSAPICRTAVPLLTIDSLGPLRPGQTPRALQGACPRLLFGWDWGSEGIPAPAVVLRFGEAVVEVEFPDTTGETVASRISSSNQLMKTADGFGPGSSLTAMMRAWGEPTFGINECALYVWFRSRPGLSFRVEVPASWQCEDVLAVEQGDVAKLAPSTVVGNVSLFREDR